MRGDCWESWPYPGRHVVSGRRMATRLHMREVRGDGVANSAGPGEALANRRYGIKGGVSAGGSRTTRVGSVEERKLRPFPRSGPRLGSAGSSVSEKNSSRKPGEQARIPTPRYRTGIRVYESEFPRMSLLGS